MKNKLDNSVDNSHADPGKAIPKDVVVQPFQLIDEQGEPFEFSKLNGKVWVASFFFTSCPSVCRQQNEKISLLQDEFADQDVKFVSITCDPNADSPEVLADYAKRFGAKPDSWSFLTGKLEEIQKLANNNFKVGFAEKSHSDRLLVIDQTMNISDTFRATQDNEFAAARKLIASLLEKGEKELTFEEKKAAVPDEQLMDDFQLTASDEQPFKASQLKGNYWLGSFFFTACPSICRIQNLEVANLQKEYADRGLKFVSITCDPENDTPDMLAAYAETFGAQKDIWYFCTGEYPEIEKIGGEFFNVLVEHKIHSDRVFLVNDQGKVLDSYRTREDLQMKRLRKQLDELLPMDEAKATEEKPEEE